MSDNIQPCKYSSKALNLQWLNNIHSSHDLFCGCPKPLHHLHKLIEKETCHTTISTAENGDDHTTKIATEEDFHIDEGDLAELFNIEAENAG